MFMKCFSFFFFFARFYNTVSLALWLEFSLAGPDPASPSGMWILLDLEGCSDGGAAGNSPHFMPLQVSQWSSVRTSVTGTSHKTNCGGGGTKSEVFSYSVASWTHWTREAS